MATEVKVKEIMEKDAYSCHVSATIGEVLRILVEKKVSGVPIVDDEKHVVGFISDGDILKYIGREIKVIDFTTFMTVIYDKKTFDQKIEELINMNVMRLATTKVISVDANCPIEEAANLLSKKKIKKAPVLEEGKLVGVISRSQITRYIVWRYLELDKQNDQ